MTYTRFATYVVAVSSILIGLLFVAVSTDASSGLPANTYAGEAKAWEQVNDGAFGLDDPSNQSPPYQSEDGFEVTVYNGQLYVGMEADNQYGARVWRTKAGVSIARSQADWEQVVDDAFGDVENNDHIDSLQGFGGYVYASTAQSSTQDGTEVWRSGSGDLGMWEQVNEDGFRGDTSNKNFKDMALFTVDGTPWLCGGTMNWTWGAQVWCTTDGMNWEQKNEEWYGFGDRKYRKVWSTGVMDGYLYAGVECYDGGACPGAVWRSDGTSDSSEPNRWVWEKVFEATSEERVDVVGVFDGFLYIGFDGGNGTEIWRSGTGEAGTWEQVNGDGFGDANNGRLVGDAGVVYNGALYVATLNQASGAQVWRTVDGTTWEQVSGFGDENTFAAQLVDFNGYLYAWATNYETGQQVWRTKAAICERQEINGTGVYEFQGVGATLDFSEEVVDSVEVCVYPNAFPAEPASEKVIKRHYEIAAEPAGGTFTVDVTLTYTDEEFAASGIESGDSAYLLHAESGDWFSCPEEDRTWDAVNNAVTCADVTTFSDFAMAGEESTTTSTATPTPTPEPTNTPTPTSEPTNTPTPEPTETPTPEPTNTPTPEPTNTPTPTPEPTNTPTPEPTNTPTPEPTNTPTPEPTNTPTPEPTETPTPTPEPTNTPTPEPTNTPTLEPADTVHVGDLDGISTNLGRNWTGTVIITLHDTDHSPVAGATISGSWSGGYSGSASCVTDAAGQCDVTTGNIHKKNPDVTFTVTDVVHDSLAYEPVDNHDPDGESDGTRITVQKP